MFWRGGAVVKRETAVVDSGHAGTLGGCKMPGLLVINRPFWPVPFVFVAVMKLLPVAESGPTTPTLTEDIGRLFVGTHRRQAPILQLLLPRVFSCHCRGGVMEVVAASLVHCIKMMKTKSSCFAH